MHNIRRQLLLGYRPKTIYAIPNGPTHTTLMTMGNVMNSDEAYKTGKIM